MPKCTSCGHEHGVLDLKGGVCTSCRKQESGQNTLPKSSGPSRASKEDSALVEDRIRHNIIPTTKLYGSIGIILTGLVLVFNGELVEALLSTFFSFAAMYALLILLDGYAEIIALLRKISSTTNLS